MLKGLKINGKVAGIIILSALVVTVLFNLACAPAQITTSIPTSPWGENYSFRYETAEEKASASVPATILVVNPFIKDVDSAFIDQIYSKIGKGFAASMGVDMDKVIISKGMTSKGPFAYYDEITYSDKKGADLLLAPKVFITTKIKYKKYKNAYGHDVDWERGTYLEGGMYKNFIMRDFEMIIGGWVAFVMEEPLSKEKMWIKRLELEDTLTYGTEYYDAAPSYAGGRFTGYNPGKSLYDGKIDVMADTLKKMYPVIMQKCWIYIDAEEVVAMKEKVKEIRELKRY